MIFNIKEKRQCESDKVSLRYSRKKYNNRKIPRLFFTRDYSVKNTCLFTRGEEYPVYNYNYSRMVDLIKTGIISDFGN